MSSKFNFDKYSDYLKNKNNEKKEVDIMENKKETINDVNDLHTEMDMLEGRIWGMFKDYFPKINAIDRNIKKLALDKEVSGTIKDLKKKGYTFENEEEMQEQLEVNYLKELGFKLSKAEEK